jgi:hypothetical protein
MLLLAVDAEWLSKKLMADNDLALSFEEHHQSKTLEQHREAERRLYLALKEVFDKGAD